MAEKELKKLIDKVKSIRKDKKGIQTEKNGWIANKFMKAEVDCKVGDEVEVFYTENGDFKNLQSLKILKSNTAESYSRENERKNVDSGNILQRATELTIAVLNNAGKMNDVHNSIGLQEIFKEACRICLDQFRRIKQELDQKIEQETKKPEKDII
jgi:hypothetical protein